jgi:hypothetical protein
MDIVTHPLYNDEMLSSQTNSLLNESKDKVNLSSLSFLQTKQRRIDHRRNKSEPLIRASLEDLSSINSIERTILESSSTSTTSNESAMSSNASYDIKRKSSKIQSSSSSRILKQTQIKSSSSSTTKKKKPWYNVSFFEFVSIIDTLHFFFQRLNKSTIYSLISFLLSSNIISIFPPTYKYFLMKKKCKGMRGWVIFIETFKGTDEKRKERKKKNVIYTMNIQ